MDETDLLLKNLEAEFGSLSNDPTDRLLEELALEFGPPTPQKPSYGIGQALFDVPAAAARTVGGIVDLPIMAGEALAGALGYNVKAPRMSEMLSKDIEKFAQDLGVRPDTAAQEAIGFLIPASKAKLLPQLGEGALSYLGYKTAEAIAPESQYAGLVGAFAPSAAIATTKAVGRTMAPAMVEKGKAMQRNLLGITQSDYGGSRKAMLEVEPEKFESQAKISADNLISEKVLPNTTDVDVLYDATISKQRELENQIIKELKKVDSSDVKIAMPKFSKALKYLEENRVAITDIDQYKAIIKEFKEKVRNKSKFVEPEIPTLYDEYGKPLPKEQSSTYRKALESYLKEQEGRSKLSLDVLNKQRKVFGEKYKTGPTSDAGFWRAFYSDLKTHIEEYAPEVKELNRKKQDLIVVEPALKRQKAAGTKALGDFKPSKLAYTTGTLGIPGITYMLGGNPLLGVPASLLLAALGTRPGRSLTGRTLQAVGERAPQATIVNVPQTLQLGGAAAARSQPQILEGE